MTVIATAIKKLSETGDQVYSVVGTVTEVDELARVCTVKPLNDDADIFDVRLQAELDSEDGLVLVPAVESWVIVTFLGPNTGYIAATGKVDKLMWKVDGQQMEMSKDGLKIFNEQTTYTEQMEAFIDTATALIDTLLQFQLATNMGPTISVMPQIVSLLEKHKADFGQVKTKLKTMLY